MRLGIHVRTGGIGYEGAARSAAAIGCETIQLFAGNPSAWLSPVIKAEPARAFRKAVEDMGLHPVCVHTPYLLNLASPDPAIYKKSIAALVDSLQRADTLGAQFIVTHIGSHRGTGMIEGVARVVAAVSEALEQVHSEVVLLLENSAGSGNSVGSQFVDLRSILDGLEVYVGRMGVCLDTAHLWGAGYDVSSPDAVEHTFREFDSIVGVEHLRLLHLNDTHVGLGAHVDRHANIGLGLISESGFEAILHHPDLQSLAGIIETPLRPESDERDLGILKHLRDTPG